jgi:MFS family permease
MLITLSTNQSYRIYAETAILPMLPMLALVLHQPIYMTQFLIPIFLLGTVVSKFLNTFGMTNALGEKRVLLLFGFISIISSLVCLNPNIATLLPAWFFQGVGVGVLTSITQGLIPQAGKDFLTTLSRLRRVFIWMPLVSTFITGFLIHYFNWQAGFIALSCFAMITWLFTLSTPIKRTKIIKEKKLGVLKSLSKNKLFLSYMLTISFAFSALIVLYTMTPVIFIRDLGWPENHYWIIIFTMTLGGFIASLITPWCVKRFQITQYVTLLLIIGIAGGLLTVLGSLFEQTPAFIISLFVTFFLTGVSTTAALSSIRKCLHSNFERILIIASAMLGIIQSIIAILFSYLAAHLFRADAFDMGVLLTLTYCFSLACFLFSLRFQATKSSCSK